MSGDETSDDHFLGLSVALAVLTLVFKLSFGILHFRLLEIFKYTRGAQSPSREGEKQGITIRRVYEHVETTGLITRGIPEVKAVSRGLSRTLSQTDKIQRRR